MSGKTLDHPHICAACGGRVETLSASEAVMGFLAWLTTRDRVTTLSAKHNAAPAVDLYEEFIKANGLMTCRDEFADYLKFPPATPTPRKEPLL